MKEDWVVRYTLPPVKINHDHHTPQQTPTVADPQSISVPRLLLCNRLEVLIHLTLLRLTWGAGSRQGGGERNSQQISQTAGLDV